MISITYLENYKTLPSFAPSYNRFIRGILEHPVSLAREQAGASKKTQKLCSDASVYLLIQLANLWIVLDIAQWLGGAATRLTKSLELLAADDPISPLLSITFRRLLPVSLYEYSKVCSAEALN